MRRIPLFLLLVKARVDIIHILLIQPILSKPQPLAEALIMDNLPLPQEPDRIIHIRIVGNAQNIVIRYASLLLCCNCISTTIHDRICG